MARKAAKISSFSAPIRVVSSKTPALMMTSHFTALVKGGKLSERVRPRSMKNQSSVVGVQSSAKTDREAIHSLSASGSAFWNRHNRRAAVTVFIDRSHCENRVVFRL